MHVLCLAQGTSAQVDPVRLERILRYLARKYTHISLLLPHESQSPVTKANIAKLRISATVDVYHAASANWFGWWSRALALQLMQSTSINTVCFIQAGSPLLLRKIKRMQAVGSKVQTVFVRLAQTKPLPLHTTLLRALAEDTHIRTAQFVITDSLQHSQVLKKRIPSSKVHYLPIVPAEMQSIVKVPAPPVAWDVSVVTPLLPGSGLDAILEAAATLPNCRILIIGDGPDRHRLECKIVHLQLEGKVQLTGWFPKLAQVIASIKSTRMFIMNSVHLQSQYALVQAMMSGVPVVSTLTELTNGLIANQQNGLITTGTKQDLQRVIQWYLAHEDRRTYMAEKAIDDAKKFDTIELEMQWNTFLKQLN